MLGVLGPRVLAVLDVSCAAAHFAFSGVSAKTLRPWQFLKLGQLERDDVLVDFIATAAPGLKEPIGIHRQLDSGKVFETRSDL